MKFLAFLMLMPALVSGQQAPGEKEQARIGALLQSLPKPTKMVIEYRQIRGLERTSQWHIGESQWWVRLHSSWGFAMSELDKAKRYRVTGVVLEQNYGVVSVWLETLSPIGE